MRINRREVVSFIDNRTREGFLSGDEIARAAIAEFAENTCHDKTAQRAVLVIEKLVVQALTQELVTEQAWPPITDCDRLDAAFEELKKCGLLACQNFSCCEETGHEIIQGQIRKLAEINRPLGYAFYHSQDTEKVLSSGVLNIFFGTGDASRKGSREVALTILKALNSSGIKATWKDPKQNKITVEGLTWQRRRYTRPTGVTCCNAAGNSSAQLRAG